MIQIIPGEWRPGAFLLPGPAGVTVSGSGGGGDSLDPGVDTTGDPAGRPGFQAKVLIVEDELLVAWEASDMLGNLGHTVCGVAASADEAIRMAAEHQPDLILMDVTLKGSQDGVDAATAIRAVQPVRILYATAHSDPATQARMAATRPAGILRKPYTDVDLEQTITTALARRSEQ